MLVRKLLAVLYLVAATSAPALETGRYNVRMFSDDCVLLATGVFNLNVDPADARGRQRVTGNRVFVPLLDQPYRFFWLPQELEGRVDGKRVRLNLDRNVFDSNLHVTAESIGSLDAGFAGTWRHVGWGLGPAGRVVGARAPAEPTTPCEALPKPVTRFPLVVPSPDRPIRKRTEENDRDQGLCAPGPENECPATDNPEA
jgi:hypothetical protein